MAERKRRLHVYLNDDDAATLAQRGVNISRLVRPMLEQVAHTVRQEKR